MSEREQSARLDGAELRRRVEQHHLACYGWALACCAQSAAQAEDVLQTVYLKVLDGSARYDGRSAFTTWLFSVIRNTAADERRRHWLHQLKLAAFGRDGRQAPHEDTAVAQMARSERRAQLQHALAALPKRQREVLHLVFYQDLTVQAAAEVLGISVGSARTHYERGKQRLRQWLKQAEVNDETGLGRQPIPSTLS